MENLGLKHGFSAPYVRLYFKDVEVTQIMEEFKYSYYEEGDDVCTLKFTVDNADAPDEKLWQEKTELKVAWGWIGDKDIVYRKIYIQQIRWEFEEKGISITIEATEKAVSMKYQDSQEVHKNISLLGAAKKFADKHNLKAMLELEPEIELEYLASPDDGMGGITGTLSDYYVTNRKTINARDRDLSKKEQAKNSKKVQITDEMIKQTSQLDVTNIGDFMKGIESGKGVKKLDTDRWKGLKMEDFSPGGKATQMMTTYGNVPQANRSDALMLNTLAMREANGPWMVDTRDDELIIRRRNFKQVPYKTFTYKGGKGELLRFSPVSKNKGRASKASNVGFQNWDPATKAFMTGNANAQTDPYGETTLSKYLPVLKWYKSAQSAGLGSKRIGDLVPETMKSISQNAVLSRGDNTLVQKDVPIFRLQTVNTRVEALEAAIKSQVDSMYNNTFNPAAVNSLNAYNAANSQRKNTAMKLNPATLKTIGDVGLVVGILVTVEGVSQKYSSNYYVTQATHIISRGQGWVVDLEMATQGVNIKASENHKKFKGSVNKIIGPENTTIKTKKITDIKTNP